MTVSYRIAAVENREGRDSQALLRDLAAKWRKAGVGVAGVLAEDDEAEGPCSAAFLRDIASGRKFSIQLEAVPPGTACHLDAGGIGEACAGLIPQIAGADIVLISKFGKTEAGGQGFIEAFLAAAEAGRPLLTTVSSRHLDAWKGFAPDAVWLEPDVRSIERWRVASR